MLSSGLAIQDLSIKAASLSTVYERVIQNITFNMDKVKKTLAKNAADSQRGIKYLIPKERKSGPKNDLSHESKSIQLLMNKDEPAIEEEKVHQEK